MSTFFIFLIIGLFQALLLIVALVRKKDSKNKALILLLSIIGFGLAMRLGLNPTTYGKWPRLLQLGDLAILLFGPAFLFFFKSTHRPIDYSQWKAQWPHLLPVFIFLLHYVIYILPLSTENFLLKEFQGDFNVYYVVLLGGGLVVNLIYWFNTLLDLKNNRELTGDAKRVLTILLTITGLILLFWSIAFFSSIINTIDTTFMNRSYQMSFVALALATILISYQALTKSGFWTPQVKRNKYTNSNLSEEQLMGWAERVKTHVVSEKAYLNPSLTLTDLSEAIGINKVLLSQTINQAFDMGFSDWINSFRVNEFISRAESNAYTHFTFIGIATECGFNNKATFNKAFKKSKGVTPTTFFNKSKVPQNALNK